MYEVQNHNVDLSIIDATYGMTEEEAAAWMARYEKEKHVQRITLHFLTSRDRNGRIQKNQGSIISIEYLKDFIREYPPDFLVSSKCCDYCKKKPAHEVCDKYEMQITGEREAEGGLRSIAMTKNQPHGCFRESVRGQFRLRPLYYVSDADKAWYKEYYGLRYSDAYEVYGMTRTGCCGCSINAKAVQDLERIRPYEPWLVEAAWNVFGDSYRYRQAYNEYKAKRRAEEKDAGQYKLEDVT